MTRRPLLWTGRSLCFYTTTVFLSVALGLEALPEEHILEAAPLLVSNGPEPQGLPVARFCPIATERRLSGRRPGGD